MSIARNRRSSHQFCRSCPLSTAARAASSLCFVRYRITMRQRVPLERPSCLLRSRCVTYLFSFFFFSSRRRHTRSDRDWSSDVCSSDLCLLGEHSVRVRRGAHVDDVNGLIAQQLVKRCESGNGGIRPPSILDRRNVWIDEDRKRVV